MALTVKRRKRLQKAQGMPALRMMIQILILKRSMKEVADVGKNLSGE